MSVKQDKNRERFLLVVSVLLFGRVALGDGFNNPAYWGGTGLLEVPNGQVIEDGRIRIGLSQVYPYRTYYASVGFLPRLEINGRLIEILNLDISNVPGWEGYGNYKDKAADFKFQIVRESKVLPALAIGGQDVGGTELFKSYYLAANKKFGLVDFTLGYGIGRLKGFFGGAEFDFAPFGLVVEYNPIEYEKDRIKAVEKSRSNLNYGLRFSPFSWLNLGLSYQRGEEFGGMFNLSFPLGKEMVPWKLDPPYTSPVDRSPERTRGREKIEGQIKEALLNQGFSGVGVSYVDQKLFVEYENTHYLSEVKALGRVMRTSVLLCPEEALKMIFVAKKVGLPLLKVEVSPDDLIGFINGRIQEREFLDLVDLSMEIETEILQHKDNKKVEWGAKPTLEAYLNDPLRFFMSRLGIDVWSNISPWRGAGLYSYIKFPIYSDIKTNLPPISEQPIRSDVVDYKRVTQPRFERAAFDQVFRLGGRTFGIFSFGCLEEMFAGTREEILYPIGDGRLTFGLEATQVTKRRPEDSFKFKDFSTYTVLGSMNYVIPEISLIMGAKTGRFLAGDLGTRFEIIRYFKDVGVGFWYTLTDMGDYVGGKPYYDKGVFVSIPLNLFVGHDSKTTYSYTLSPWTRDCGQMLWYRNLYDYLYRFYPFQVRTNIRDLLN